VVNTVRPAGGAGAWDAPALDAATYADTWEWTTKR
jgi:hypothetical protein